MATNAILLGSTFAPPQLKLLYRQVANVWNAYTVTLPRLGWGRIDDSQRWLVDALDRLAPGDEPLTLLGHSQGGLQACLYAAARPHVQQVITIGTPHHGTTTARLLSWCWPALGDMLPDSPFLARYEQDCLPAVTSRLVSVFSYQDPLVQPGHSAYVAGARNYVVARQEHHLAMAELTPDAHLFHRRRWASTGGNHLTGLFDRSLWRQLRQDLA